MLDRTVISIVHVVMIQIFCESQRNQTWDRIQLSTDEQAASPQTKLHDDAWATTISLFRCIGTVHPYPSPHQLHTSFPTQTVSSP
jgi:hypothetical protein